jgi:hypothetical protein
VPKWGRCSLLLVGAKESEGQWDEPRFGWRVGILNDFLCAKSQCFAFRDDRARMEHLYIGTKLAAEREMGSSIGIAMTR